MGRPFVKRYRQERELAVILALDVSASGSFGSARRSKRETAVEIAATLANSASRSGDKVGLLLFTDEVELFLPPRKGRRHILRVIKEMLFFEPRHRGTNIPAALGFLNHVVRRRSIVFLFTDFLHSFAAGARSVQAGRDLVQEIGMTNARHDLICVHLHDARERQLPNAVRETYEKSNSGRLENLDRSLRQAGVDTLRFTTGEAFAPELQKFFETRRGRRRG
jgi:uncharacterized protein (DUF58 family)